MELAQLQESLQIIFDKEENDLKVGRPTYLIKKTTPKPTIEYPNCAMLVSLFSLIRNDAKLRSFYIDSLKKIITNCEEIQYGQKSGGFSLVGNSTLCFYALTEIGYGNEAIESFKKRHGGRQGIYTLIFYLIDFGIFSSKQLTEISDILKKDYVYLLEDIYNPDKIGEKLQEKLISTRFERLSEQIKKVNREINEDEKTVIEKFKLLGFRDTFSELLESLDEYIMADTAKVVNAGIISALRTFMGDLLKDIAVKIAFAEKEEIQKIEGKGEMGAIRSYLKNRLDLTEDDNKFIDSFVNILHGEGGHSFFSEKEYFRLSRNIAIEVALFILSKYEKKYKK